MRERLLAALVLVLATATASAYPADLSARSPGSPAGLAVAAAADPWSTTQNATTQNTTTQNTWM